MEKPNQVQTIPTYHQDVIHDINFNYFGTRMATVSSDKSVKIWNKDSQGVFKFHSEFKPQDGPIWKVKWALPEFGNVIVACSFDRTFTIYEETKNNQKGVENRNQTIWAKKHKDCESKEAIEDIKFAPRHQDLGSRLTLACGSRDGLVRICRTDNDISLGQWETECKIQVSKNSVNCLSWNKCSQDPLMLAIGTKQHNQFNQETSFVQYSITQPNQNKNLNKDSQEKESYFYIYIKNSSQGWTCLYQDTQNKCAQDGINDISWVAQNGRDYHQIAICGSFGVKVIKFTYRGPNDFDIVTNDIIRDQEIWRVAWNIMGTLIACSDSNNNVQVFSVQKDINEWKSVATLQEQADQQQESEFQ